MTQNTLFYSVLVAQRQGSMEDAKNGGLGSIWPTTITCMMRSLNLLVAIIGVLPTGAGIDYKKGYAT